MRIALLSDLHANIQALEKVEAHFLFPQQSAEKVWFLGDIVDRGPDPKKVLLWVRDHVELKDWVMGNHEAIMMGFADEKAISLIDPLSIRTMARQYKELINDKECQAFIEASFTHERLSEVEHILDGTMYILSHAGLKDPIGLYRYIYGWTSDIVPASEFEELEERIVETGLPGVLFFGHSHVPTLISGYRKAEEWVIESIQVVPFTPYQLTPDRYWLVNPGSVGSPRDLDTRAGYAMLDTLQREIIFYRVKYDLQGTIDGLLYGRYESVLEDKLRQAPAHRDTPSVWLDHYHQVRGFQEGE